VSVALAVARCRTPDKLLVVKGINGLGDRMLSLATGILYARLAGRSLLVDWSDPIYSGDGSNVFPRLFGCPDSKMVWDIPETDSVAPALWRGSLRMTAADLGRQHRDFSPDSWRRASIALGWLSYDQDVAVMWTTTSRVHDMRGHFQGEFARLGDLTDDEIMGALLREDLALAPDIRDRVERFRAEHFRSPMVGVHVRYSDHRVQLRGILARTTEILRRERTARIFLGTDNVEVKRVFDSVYGRVLATPHWYPLPGLKAHGNAACGDRLENAREALVDLYLLAACDYLVCDTSSSFARVGARLSELPASRIVDVKRKPKLGRRVRRKMWHRWLKYGLFTWGVRILGARERLRATLYGVRRREDVVA
jgi:hypothetical protein